jgi:nitrogen regulatory protein PII
MVMKQSSAIINPARPDAIISTARTGRSGDGKILSSELQLIRLRAGESGPQAI